MIHWTQRLILGFMDLIGRQGHESLPRGESEGGAKRALGPPLSRRRGACDSFSFSARNETDSCVTWSYLVVFVR